MTSTGPDDQRTPRALGTVDVVGLGINCVIGSGVFLLPGPVAEGLGPASIVAVGAAGTLAFLIALCFAEAASRVGTTGGAHAYTHEAFGPGAGFVVGWTATLAGAVAWAALVNAWALALGPFVPEATSGIGRWVAMVGLLLVLAVANTRGVVLGSRLSWALSAVKLTALTTFVATGLFFVQRARLEPFAPSGWGAMGDATLLMLYAFVGFENLVVPAGEMQDAKRTVPRAIAAIMMTVTVLYLGVQVVTVGTLDDPAGRSHAVADAAATFLGPLGASAIAIAVVLSILGVNAASALVLPRRLYALASLGPAPAAFGRLHPVHRTPWLAIVVSYALVAIVAGTGTFRQLAQIAVVARFVQYAPTCLAVLALRRRFSASGAFRLPGGSLVPWLALGLSALLLSRADPTALLIGGAVAASGYVVYRLRIWTVAA